MGNKYIAIIIAILTCIVCIIGVVLHHNDCYRDCDKKALEEATQTLQQQQHIESKDEKTN